MTDPRRPVASAAIPCKCCGHPAALYGVVDFNKNCEVARQRNVLPVAGVPVYYHRCPGCGFVFTAAFDDFTPDDFAELVYNREYPLVDPDFARVRPEDNAALLAEIFGGTPDLRIVDYGGGNGLTAELLRRAGFRSVTTYDPFVPEHATRPAGRFDLVICFEVVEHAPDPHATFREIDGLLAPDGLVLFSTLLQPDDFEAYGLNWWYAAPRNGHVSLHSRASLLAVAEPMGYTFGSFHDGFHALFRRVPGFASHLIRDAA